MNKERELLKKILMLSREDKSCMSWGVARDIEYLLAQPEQEPVAWMYEWYEGDTESTNTYCGSEKPFQEDEVKPFNLRPLYEHPKREPLSDEEMRAIWKEGIRREIPFVEIGRAIEKAHGIGVDDE